LEVRRITVRRARRKWRNQQYLADYRTFLLQLVPISRAVQQQFHVPIAAESHNLHLHRIKGVEAIANSMPAGGPIPWMASLFLMTIQ
jgi:hypothetical protein